MRKAFRSSSIDREFHLCHRVDRTTAAAAAAACTCCTDCTGGLGCWNLVYSEYVNGVLALDRLPDSSCVPWRRVRVMAEANAGPQRTVNGRGWQLRWRQMGECVEGKALHLLITAFKKRGGDRGREETGTERKIKQQMGFVFNTWQIPNIKKTFPHHLMVRIMTSPEPANHVQAPWCEHVG